MFHRLALACALLLGAPAWAADFTVTTTFDTWGAGASDANPGDGICATAGGECTLRAAIEEANARPGPDVINFNIPGGGLVTIYLQMGLPDITDTVTIDGTLQPGNAQNTLPQGTNAVVAVGIDGGDAGPGSSGLVFKPGANHSEVRALRITRFTGLAGIVIDGEGQSGQQTLGDIRIYGNFIGTDGSGMGDDVGGGFANHLHGVYVTGNAMDVQIGTGSPGSRNLIVGSEPGSAVTAAYGANNVRVYGNLIGTNRAGTQRVGTQVGVLAEEAARIVDVLDNTIGASHTGVLIRHGGTSPLGDANRIRGNRIGIGIGGENIAGSEDGIHITNAARPTMPRNNTIGGAVQDAGNTIAHWGRNGVRVSRTNNASGDTSPLNVIRGNSIFGNGALGIELIDQTSIPPLGANPQDPPPPAINGGQAAPFITSALIGGGVQLGYQFSGPPGPAYVIEIFTNAACHASGYGEGQTLLTRFTLADASAGQHAVQLQPLLPGTVLTMTATAYTQGGSAMEGTSEFSRCLAVGQTANPPGQNPNPPGGNIAAVPTLGHAALALLGALVGGLGLRGQHRKQS